MAENIQLLELIYVLDVRGMLLSVEQPRITVTVLPCE